VGKWETCFWLSTLSTAPAFPQLSDPPEGGTGATVRAKRVNGGQYPGRVADRARVREDGPAASAFKCENPTMSSPPTEFHKIWIEQRAATEDIREAFGLENALDYVIAEKLFTFLMVSERDPAFAMEVPAFVAEIRRLFSRGEIHEYLDHLERAKFLAPQEPDLETGDLDEDLDEAPCLENPVMGAEELLRFSRVRQLLQS
jgi:hypothetical protein